MAAGDIVASKVVDGHPSFPCGPCATQPQECCLYPYPWDSEGTLRYSHDDLPATIVLVEPEETTFTLTKDATRFGFTDGFYFVSAINEPNGQWWLTQENWYGEIGAIGVAPCSCLISIVTAYDTIEDEFLDTYTVTFTDSEGSVTATVTRTDLCTWEGTSANGSPFTLDFWTWLQDGDILGPDAITWQIRAFFNTLDDPIPSWANNAYKQSNGTADHYANTPIGNYGYGWPPPGDGPGAGRSITVSP